MSALDFLRRENDAFRRFMDRFTIEDMAHPGLSRGYSREYRCDCGFSTSEPEDIHTHTLVCPSRGGAVPSIEGEGDVSTTTPGGAAAIRAKASDDPAPGSVVGFCQ